MNVENYSERVYIARTHELASESHMNQPYERVPNCLRFSFSNLFITCIYPKHTLHAKYRYLTNAGVK